MIAGLLFPYLPNRRSAGCKYVLELKEFFYGIENRYKARLVAKDFHHIHAIYFNATFSSVGKSIIIRQLYANNVFLNALL